MYVLYDIIHISLVYIIRYFIFLIFLLFDSLSRNLMQLEMKKLKK